MQPRKADLPLRRTMAPPHPEQRSVACGVAMLANGRARLGNLPCERRRCGLRHQQVDAAPGTGQGDVEQPTLHGVRERAGVSQDQRQQGIIGDTTRKEDYARMVDDGLLPEDAEPFDGLMTKCAEIAERINRASKQRKNIRGAMP